MDAKFGGNKFGGQTFGGNTYGGNTFGGNQFGANQALARLLISAAAPPSVGPQDFKTPGLPPLTAPDAGAAPPPAAAPAPVPAPVVAPQAPAMAPPAVVPPMPDSVPVGMDPAKADVLKVLAEMQRTAFQNKPSPWTFNQGTLADQQG